MSKRIFPHVKGNEFKRTRKEGPYKCFRKVRLWTGEVVTVRSFNIAGYGYHPDCIISVKAAHRLNLRHLAYDIAVWNRYDMAGYLKVVSNRNLRWNPLCARPAMDKQR